MLVEYSGEPLERIIYPFAHGIVDTNTWSRIFDIYDHIHSIGFCHNHPLPLHAANVFYDKATDQYRLINLWRAFNLLEPDKRWDRRSMERLLAAEKDNIEFYKDENRKRINGEW
ncbi:uncharacterized protein L199_004020 [Kwoniella botswanensis]|uniref:uncharacterized protein n=1 Tax=Kwoniella botswanensis TaxID=1268659 RepID=UPI00315D31C8